MAQSHSLDEPVTKRRKLEGNQPCGTPLPVAETPTTSVQSAVSIEEGGSFTQTPFTGHTWSWNSPPKSTLVADLPRSLSRDVTPPASKRRTSAMRNSETVNEQNIGTAFPLPVQAKNGREGSTDVAATTDDECRVTDKTHDSEPTIKLVRSPFQLTRIRDLPAEHNVDTITLYDILRDPMIKELWQFNFLYDIDFIMAALDPDVAATVRVKIVHGFWKSEDARRLRLVEQAKAYPNVQLIAAHMPEPFGTHHSKMMILIRHDELAQVVIHTANMIARDWANLTQGVWRSPELPLHPGVIGTDQTIATDAPIGSGVRFKKDLLRYLKAYSGRTRSLVEELEKYDFQAIHAAFVSSAPGRFSDTVTGEQPYTQFGWPGLRQIFSSIPCVNTGPNPGSIVVEISSIATLTEKWLDNFLSALRSSSNGSPFAWAQQKKAKVRFVFPSDEEIPISLDGYESGASIHMRIQSAAQAKQLKMLRPMLCHWADPRDTDTASKREAYRARAAPHIKTYICFTNENMEEIEWAMLTSANMSQQAWGAMPSGGSVRISSYEVGVVVWPQVFAEKDKAVASNVRMVPVFGHDTPTTDEAKRVLQQSGDGDGSTNQPNSQQIVMGIRMPYDLPLTPYGPQTMPWCASATYLEPDWKGRVWGDVDPATLAALQATVVQQGIEGNGA